MTNLRTIQLAPRQGSNVERDQAEREAGPEGTGREFRIRRALIHDVRLLAVLWREMMEFHRRLDPAFEFGPDAQASIERHLAETIRSAGGRIFVAEAEGRLIGYVLCEIQERKPIYPAGRYGFISDLAVTLRWRRRGVGRQLVTHVMRWFRENGVTAIELFVLESNQASTAFWESMGFRHYLRLLRCDIRATPDAAPSDEAKENNG
jgi:ribosomal protein S18 acetylase RimI-like enzyme